MLNVYTVSLFGHRTIDNHLLLQDKIVFVVKKLLLEKEFIRFLIGRDGEFDIVAASAILRAKRELGKDNCSLVWVCAYPKAEYLNNQTSFDRYYDEIELCEEAAAAYPKAAITIRNKSMVSRSDLILCYIEHRSGGAYKAVQYAKSLSKQCINLTDVSE